MNQFRASLLSAWLMLGVSVAGLSAEETVVTKDGAAEARTFTPRPEGATNQFLIGSPKFEAGANVAVALGGPDVTHLLTSTFENLLFDSGRFQVKKGGVGSYVIVGSVTSLTIKQGKESSAPAPTKFIGDLLNKVVKSKDQQTQEAITNATMLNVKSETEKISVACTVAVQLLDGENTILEKGTGQVTTEVTVKDMRVALGGVNVKESDPTMTVLTQYNTQVVERAIYNAMVQMLPKLDRRLASHEFKNKPATTLVAQALPPQQGPTPEQMQALMAAMGAGSQPPPATTSQATGAAPAPTPAGAVARGAFCSKCGVKMSADANFCGGCGAKIAAQD